MDSVAKDSHSEAIDASNSCENTDSFDFKECNDTLPNVNKLEQGNSEDESDESFSDAREGEEIDLDDEAMEELYKNMPEEDLLKYKEEATYLKNKGNDSFKKADYKESVSFYTQALNVCPMKYSQDRSVLYANRAAANISLEKKEDAVLDCNKAIELNPEYMKAIIRRAQLHRKMDNLERSLEDYQRILELDKTNVEARQACATLPAEIAEKNEKLKTEMLGKLKELGNVCLKPFGLSTDNFKVVQDPSSGGYSINFQNNR